LADTDKKELWRIIARAECPKRSHDCARCVIRPKCVERAKLAAENIRKVYILTTRRDDSLFVHANINDIPEAEVVDTHA
jgi:hypothetical protein